MKYTKCALSKEKREELEHYQYAGPDGHPVLKLRGPQVISEDKSVILVEGLLADLAHSGHRTPVLKENRGYYEEVTLESGKSTWIPCMDTYLLQIKGLCFWIAVNPREYLLAEGESPCWEYVECPAVYDIQPAPHNQEFLTEDENAVLSTISDRELWEAVQDALTVFLLPFSSTSHPELLTIRDARKKHSAVSCCLIADKERYLCSYHCPPEGVHTAPGKAGTIRKNLLCAQNQNHASALYYVQSTAADSDTFFAGESAMVLGKEQYFLYGSLYLKTNEYLSNGGQQKTWAMDLQHRDYVQDPAPECYTPENKDEIRRLWAAALLGAWISCGKRHKEKPVLQSLIIHTYQKEALGSGVVIRDYGANGGERICAEGKDNSISVIMSDTAYLLRLTGGSKTICGWWIGDGKGRSICVDGKDYDTRQYNITALGYDMSHPARPEIIGSPATADYFDIPAGSSFAFRKLSAKRCKEINAMKIPVGKTNFFVCDPQKTYLASQDEDILFLPVDNNFCKSWASEYRFAVTFGEKYTLCRIDQEKSSTSKDPYNHLYKWKTDVLNSSWAPTFENIRSEPIKLCISLYRKAYQHLVAQEGPCTLHHLVNIWNREHLIPLHWMESVKPEEQFRSKPVSPERIKSILSLFPARASGIDPTRAYLSNGDESILLIPLADDSSGFLLVWGQEALYFACPLDTTDDLILAYLSPEQPVGEYLCALLAFLLDAHLAEQRNDPNCEMTVVLTTEENRKDPRYYKKNYIQVDGPNGFFKPSYISIPKELGISGANLSFFMQHPTEADLLHFIDLDLFSSEDLKRYSYFSMYILCNRIQNMYFLEPTRGGTEYLLLKGDEYVKLAFTPIAGNPTNLEMKTSRALSVQGKNTAARLFMILARETNCMDYFRYHAYTVPRIFCKGKELGTEKIFTFGGYKKCIGYYLPECSEEIFSNDPEEETLWEEVPTDAGTAENAEVDWDAAASEAQNTESSRESPATLSKTDEDSCAEQSDAQPIAVQPKQEAPIAEPSISVITHENTESRQERPVIPMQEPERTKAPPSDETAYTGCLNHLWQVILCWAAFILLDIVMWWCVVDGPFAQRPFHVLGCTATGVLVLAWETFLWYRYKR